jgi:hypothetical protein
VPCRNKRRKRDSERAQAGWTTCQPEELETGPFRVGEPELSRPRAGPLTGRPSESGAAPRLSRDALRRRPSHRPVPAPPTTRLLVWLPATRLLVTGASLRAHLSIRKGRREGRRDLGKVERPWLRACSGARVLPSAGGAVRRLPAAATPPGAAPAAGRAKGEPRSAETAQHSIRSALCHSGHRSGRHSGRHDRTVASSSLEVALNKKRPLSLRPSLRPARSNGGCF